MVAFFYFKPKDVCFVESLYYLHEKTLSIIFKVKVMRQGLLLGNHRFYQESNPYHPISSLLLSATYLII
ncbi:hypothetical protein EUGRSUZ_G01833 [Eucalyptus grandis]|uniref:Uncharacterized protein n=2 Tax=Eucalyptus grandis TaxID=71139 RepID=A0ACC3K5D4_EUCGR|nr:hypothetical protein EUGRSUZ_G01833 [Eucalyptus grandis]